MGAPRNKAPRLTIVALVASLAMATSGCVAVVAAAAAGAVGYYQYDKNESSQDFQTELEEAWEATLEALEETGYQPETQSLGATEGVASGDKLFVSVERHALGVIRVRVRVGMFDMQDNRRRAALVLEAIARRLEG